MAPPVKDVSVEKFAELVGVTSERIYQLIQSGLPHRKRDEGTRIVPKDAIKWLRQRDRDEAVVEKALDEAKERARKTRAEADMKEIQLAELRGSLVQTAEVSAFIEAFVGGFASVAAGQLGRFEREMVKVTNAPGARALRTKIHRALMEGAQRYADQMTAKGEGFAAELAAAGEDDAAA